MALSTDSFTDMLTTERLRAFAERRSGPSVSMFMPTFRRSRETEQNPIRLKNQLAAIERLAEESEMDGAEVAAVLGPARDRLDDYDFWQQQADGLAYLLGRDATYEFRLPERVEELAYLGDRFCVRPLVRSAGRGAQFLVLALSQNRVRLFDCTRRSAREMDLYDIPKSLEESVGYDYEQKSLQFHTGAAPSAGGRAAMFHGQGRQASEEDKEELREFFRQIDAGLGDLLPDPERPVVLACVGYLAPIFRDVAKRLKVAPECVAGNPDEAKMEDLHARAVEVAKPYLDSAETALHERIAERVGTEEVEQTVGGVLTAAHQGRLGGLLVDCAQPVWGRYEPDTNGLETHDTREPGDDDVLDLAIAHALSTGAEVFAVDRDRIPGEGSSPVAGLLRF